VPIRAASRRLASGKRVKPARGKKCRGRSQPRPKSCLRRALPVPSAQAAAWRTAGNRPVLLPLPSGSNRRNSEAAPPGQWRDGAEFDRAPSDRTPEAQELKRKRAQLAVLESELARQERLLSRLRAELAPFEARYFRQVGVRCAKLDEIEARIAEAYASIYPDDMVAQDAACQARKRASRSRSEILRRRPARNFDPPPALKRLYRAVARRVHPDLGGTPADRSVRERLMAHATKAYQSGDERRLRAIVSEYEFCPETVMGEGTPIELVRVIRRIAQARVRCEEIQEEMDRVRSSELFRFMGLVESQTRRGRDLFADAVAAVKARIAAARLKLAHLEAASAGR